MKEKEYFVLAGVILLFIGVIVIPATAPKEKIPKIDPLQCSQVAFHHLDGILVTIDRLDEGFAKAGLTPEVIIADLESTLREFNIRVLSSEDMSLIHNWQERDYQGGILAVSLDVCKQPNMQGVAYSAILKVQRMVTFGTEDPPIRCMATTWLRNDIGFIADFSDTESIRRAINTALDEFMYRYLDAYTPRIT